MTVPIEDSISPRPRLTLADLLRAKAPTPAPKEYADYLPIITTAINPPVVRVCLALLAAALRGHQDWASAADERSPDTFRPDRYARAIEEIRAGVPIHHPWLSFRYGRICVTDGRHRLYALIDEGYTHAEVTCDHEHAAIVRTIGAPDVQIEAMPRDEDGNLLPDDGLPTAGFYRL
ncbi:hypothetical protein [Dyella sp.]|uniref:hypothetical protein n=1 Tax=Dyella sp. TaxID=1869338 RepID=UPI00283DCFE0|nr:hypothetical protein [Dyella sp.]MDR3444473.1 hypothetical protein [Dyella sp.]